MTHGIDAYNVHFNLKHQPIFIITNIEEADKSGTAMICITKSTMKKI